MFKATQIRLLLPALFCALSVQADPSEFRTFEQAPQIKEIADKYSEKSKELEAEAQLDRAPASFTINEPSPVLSGPLGEVKKTVRDWFEKTKSDKVAEFLRMNFYPELKGSELMAYGSLIAPEPAQIADMDRAALIFKRLWRDRDALSQGGTQAAGQTIALLVRKFSSRDDIFEVSKETDTTPYEDLKADASKLTPALAYRVSWAVGKLAEFRNPDGVHWSPTARFQLGKENQEFINGFMLVQFEEKSRPQLVPQSASLGQ